MTRRLKSGIFAIFVTTSTGGHQMYHTFKDHQGSLAAVVHGNTVERLSHDPWGRRRNPAGFGYDNVSHTFDRGFTLHEHLSRFGLVNMDGRMYDPFTASFLSADRYLQDPSSAQGFNRYAYCMYNPLRYVDPTGWFMGPPRSKSGMIQDYLSDPCPITRQNLLEAGMYDIEGGYGWYGGEGSMSAGWMESDGSVHTSQWDIFTSGGGFDAGAWAISASFSSTWINECKGLLSYEYRDYVNINSFINVNTNHNVSRSFSVPLVGQLIQHVLYFR